MRTLAVALMLCAVVAAQPASDLERLFHTYQWFELRAAANNRSPALIRAGVATAFNDSEKAERLARDIIKAAPKSADADEAYFMLSQIYRRSGRYDRWVRSQREWAAALPDSALSRQEGEDQKELGGRPDQRRSRPRYAVLKHDPGDLTMPVTVNGQVADYIFDTGAQQSVLSEKRAKQLGLTLDATDRVVMGSSGQSTGFRTATAKEIDIGGNKFQNVSFAVIKGIGPFTDIDFGIIGLPVLVGLGAIHWSPEGAVEVGAPAADVKAEPNLVFDRHLLLLKARVFGRDVMTTFDTGAMTTDLNANFVETFPQVVKDAKKGTTDITGVGGTKTFESLQIPEVVFGIGPAQIPLRPATVTMQALDAIGGKCCVGNAGLDLLKAGFTIDFSTMTLRVNEGR